MDEDNKRKYKSTILHFIASAVFMTNFRWHDKLWSTETRIQTGFNQVKQKSFALKKVPCTNASFIDVQPLMWASEKR